MENWVWIAYHIMIATFIGIDLSAGFLRRYGLTLKQATKWFALWVSIAISFGIFILYHFGLEASAIYYAAYVLEYTLSMDNLFVFAIIFTYFTVPDEAQLVVLYAGIIGAMIMRGTFMYGGLWLLDTFSWMIFVFGAFLVYLGLKLLKGGGERVEVERNPLVRWARKFLPITDHYAGSKFIAKGSNRMMFTPLIVVLLAIESTDLIFAFDSIPAAIALTKDFFIAYTSNISAILGLRTLYFIIAQTMFKFKYVNRGLAFILIFLGMKFLFTIINIQLPTLASLAIIFGVLSGSIAASILVKLKEPETR